MNATPKPEVRSKSEPGKCLARSVAEALAEDPTLEAVTVDQAHHTISVATLGQTDVPKLTERISATVQHAQEAAATQPCTLLAGETTCQTCGQPLSDFERQKITVRQEAATTTIARVTCPTAPKFWRWRDIPWPKVVQRDVEFLEHAEEVNEWKTELAAAILCGALGLGAWFFRAYPLVGDRLRARLCGGQLVHARRKSGSGCESAPSTFTSSCWPSPLGSASIGAWGEGTTLLFLFSLSGALEHFALGRTQREIRSLFREAPKSATVLDERGQEREVQVEKLRPGLRLLVKPGAQFPVDAEIVKGQTASDESNLTGEAAPVEKGIGDSVLAGTINLWGAVEVVVLRPVAESSLQKIIRLIKDAQQQKAPAQQFTDRFGTYYTYSVLGLSLVMFFVWWLGFGQAPFAAQECRAQRLLSRHDAARGGLAVRAGALDPFRGAGGDCLGRPPRHPFPRRRGGGKARRRQHRRPRQDRHADHRRTPRRDRRELSARAARRRWPGWPSRWNAFPPTRWPAPSLATANNRACKPSNWPTSNPSPARACAPAATATSACWAAANGWPRAARRGHRPGAAPPSPASRKSGWPRATCSDGWSCATTSARKPATVVEELHREGLRAVVLTGDRKATAEHLRHGVADSRTCAPS